MSVLQADSVYEKQYSLETQLTHGKRGCICFSGTPCVKGVMGVFSDRKYLIVNVQIEVLSSYNAVAGYDSRFAIK